MDGGIGIFVILIVTVTIIIGSAINSSKEKDQSSGWDEFRRREEQHAKYAKIIGDASVMYLDDIAARYPNPVEQVRDDLAGIDSGRILSRSLP